MTLFDILKNVLYQKKKNLLDNQEDEADLQPYIIQRWLSMYSGDMTKMLNETVNKNYQVYTDKQMWHSMLLDLIPKSKFKKIDYIKKPEKKKKVASVRDDVIKSIANANELSTREVKCYLETFDISIDNEMKAFK